MFQPKRGDEVEAWIKQQRDQDATDPKWDVLDDLLNIYRTHADTGTPLLSPEDMSG